MSFMRSRLFIFPVLFFCFAIPFTANAFLPSAIGLALRFTPAAAKFMKAGIKAVKPAKRISPTKFELSLSTERGLENRILQVVLGTGITAATSLALYAGYSVSSPPPNSWTCDNGVSFVGGSSVGRDAYWTSYGVVAAISDQSNVSPNPYIQYSHSSGLYPLVTCTPSLSVSASDKMLLDIELNPSLAQTDNIVAGLKAMSDNDWDAIVEIIDTGAIQPESDYFSGDVIMVNTLGQVVLNGVIQNAASYIGKDGLSHVLTLDSNRNVLVDGQPSTGFTVSNPSAGTSTPVTTSGATTTTQTTDPATGVQTTQTVKNTTNNLGDNITTTTTTIYNPSTGQSTTNTSSTTTTGTAADAATAVSGNGIGSSFENFGLGVGKTVGDQFNGLTTGGAELCFNSAFAGTHCLSDFDKGGLWTGYVRTFFGFLGGLLAFFIPLYVALRL